jgi:tRNA (cytidine/uridine-2'-O-)-methyltransferase
MVCGTMPHKTVENRDSFIKSDANRDMACMRIALFEPDIPQNAAAIIRLGACLGVPVDIIEPCGFLFSDAGFRRAGMDYLELADVVRHRSWEAFFASRTGRIVLMTTRAAVSYTAFPFLESDIVLLGRESAGVPETVHQAADARLRIPLRPGLRSLNLALTAAMATGEGLRQTGGFPKNA